MCDTLVALPAATAESVTLFGKNSDRERSEAQVLEIIPSQRHEAGELVRCTYMSVPQVLQTHRALLCRPFWMWGAEMGVNEHGVAIGNEAVFARAPGAVEPALLGMDLVRLGLERGACAIEALEVVIDLLEQHGQGGNCGLASKMYYQNSFIIADRCEAYVLETIERDWVVEQVRDARALSNVYSIGRGPFRRSAGLDERIRSAGWSSDKEIDYSAVIADPERLSSGSIRYARSCTRLTRQATVLTAKSLMGILRDHGHGTEDDLSFRPPRTKHFTVCAHASDDEPRGQTVGSLVSELWDEAPVHWVTASASVCVSVFKPVFLDLELPGLGLSPKGQPNKDAFWWRHEKLAAELFRAPDSALTTFRTQRDLLEEGFSARVASARTRGAKERQDVAEACWRDATKFENGWFNRLVKSPSVLPR